MSRNLSADLTVGELMTRWAETIGVFLRHRMACVGCNMAPFDTVVDAARMYRISPEHLLTELAKVVAGEDAPSRRTEPPGR